MYPRPFRQYQLLYAIWATWGRLSPWSGVKTSGAAMEAPLHEEPFLVAESRIEHRSGWPVEDTPNSPLFGVNQPAYKRIGILVLHGTFAWKDVPALK